MAFNPVNCTSAFGFQDGFQTTLSSAMSDTDTTCPLTLLPTPTEATLVIEPGTSNEEEIYYTSKGTGVVNIPSVSAGRGVNGTARAHNSGVVVKMLLTKAGMDAIKYGGALLTPSIVSPTITTPTVKGIDTGWIGANETLTCGADNVLTGSTAFVANLSIGDKIWVKDDGTDWYGYVVSKPTGTTFGIMGGTSAGAAATITNGSTITSPYYSHATSPVGFPQWFSFTPTLSVASGTAPTYTENFVNKFCITGRKVTVQFLWSNTTGGTKGAGVNALNATMPLTMTNTLLANRTHLGSGYYLESGGTAFVGLYAASTSAVGFVFTDLNQVSGAAQDQDARTMSGTYTFQI